MYYHKFDLVTPYITQTKYCFNFFDILIKSEQLVKREVIQEEGIPASTYFTAQSKEQPSANEIIDKMLKRFNYNRVSLSRIQEYEKVISRIYSLIYYKNALDFDKEMEILNVFIEDRTFLLPVIKLIQFQLYIYMKPSDILLNHVVFREKYQYLVQHKSFFSEELLGIFYSVSCFFEKSRKINLDDINLYLNSFPFYKGIVYASIGSMYYYEKNYSMALLYEGLAKVEYQERFNPSGYFTMSSNIAMIYNTIEQYGLAYNHCMEFVPYILFSKSTFREVWRFKMQYYQALFMLGKLNDLKTTIDLFQKLEQIDFLYKGFCLLAKKEYQKTKEFLEENKQFDLTTDYVTLSLLYNSHLTKKKISEDSLYENQNKTARKIIKLIQDKIIIS